MIHRAGFMPSVVEKAPTGSIISYDIYTRMMRDRILFLEEFNTESANALVAQLLYLDSEDNTKDISLYVNSYGGSVLAGLAIYDTMQFIKSPVSTICIGTAMSCGAFILIAGAKGKRFALPHARIMIHQPLISNISGQATDVILEAKEMAHCRQELEEIMAKHTGQTVEKINRDCERNNYMSAEEACKYGIIDAVISGSKK